jgi:hypothetical protein
MSTTLATITSVRPGGVFIMSHKFFYYVLVNNTEKYDQTAFDSPAMCKNAMRNEVTRLRTDYGV